MIGWHGTKHEFTEFSEEHFGSDPDRSPNGCLGVWVFLMEGCADRFGGRVLRVEAEPRKILRKTVTEMRRDHDAATKCDDGGLSFFTEMRRRLLSEGWQALEIVERGGQADMAIILDLSCIRSVEETARPAAAMKV